MAGTENVNGRLAAEQFPLLEKIVKTAAALPQIGTKLATIRNWKREWDTLQAAAFLRECPLREGDEATFLNYSFGRPAGRANRWCMGLRLIRAGG